MRDDEKKPNSFCKASDTNNFTEKTMIIFNQFIKVDGDG